MHMRRTRRPGRVAEHPQTVSGHGPGVSVAFTGKEQPATCSMIGNGHKTDLRRAWQSRYVLTRLPPTSSPVCPSQLQTGFHPLAYRYRRLQVTGSMQCPAWHEGFS